jgi:predicted peroxiredoxin
MTSRALALVIGSLAEDRLHAALSIAAAAAALGRRVEIFFHAGAVAALAPGAAFAGDAQLADAGVPTIADLLETAAALGVGITACQSGLALTGIDAGGLGATVRAGGLVDFLGRDGDAELLLG